MTNKLTLETVLECLSNEVCLNVEGILENQDVEFLFDKYYETFNSHQITLQDLLGYFGEKQWD